MSHALKLYAILIAQEEVNPPSDSSATGLWLAKADKCHIKYELEIRGLAVSAITAHLHLGIRGQNGPIVVTLVENQAVGPEGRVLVHGVITANDLEGVLVGQDLEVLLKEIQQGHIYVNVHEAVAGLPQLIRGQVDSKKICEKKRCCKKRCCKKRDCGCSWLKQKHDWDKHCLRKHKHHKRCHDDCKDCSKW